MPLRDVLKNGRLDYLRYKNTRIKTLREERGIHMKKTISFILSIFMIFGFTLTGCAAQEEPAIENAGKKILLQIDNPMMTVNGVEKEIDPGRGTVPIMANNRTLVPVRAIIEEIGGSVTWEEHTQTATLTYNGDAIQLTVDSTTAYRNEEVVTLDVAPVSIHDRIMLPIRFIAESFHFSVDWNEEQQMITITNNTQAQTPSVTPTPEEPGNTNHANALVVYFSATGNTRTLAEKIAAAAESELYEIIPVEPYTSADLNYNTDSSRANRELNTDARPEIETMDIEIAAYDVIMLGYPIWWGQCPPPVRTFLDTYDLSGKTIMPFCTSGSSGISGSLQKIQELSPNSTVTEGFRGTGATTEEQITEWFYEDGFTPQKANPTEPAEGNTLYIQVGDTTLTAALVENSSTAALKDLLAEGPLTVKMSDYGNFEKVGNLGTSLPRNDEQITTEPGDLILYQGNSFVIYYDTNSWSFTRLGKINGITQNELKEILGNGDITIILSMEP